VAPVTRRVRAYFAPVNRATGTPTVFDAAQMGAFALDAPPAPWVDLGWCTTFARKSETKVAMLTAGAPAVVQSQVRSQVEATVQLAFASWGKLQLALASGSQQMNLLRTAGGAAVNGSGGLAAAAVPLVAGSTATSLSVGAAEAQFQVGELVAIDEDYVAQVGFVGSGVSAAYVSSPASVGSDINYVRRITLNVGRVVGIGGGVLQLGGALLAGAPPSGMQVSPLVGFVDREGGRFFQEWSGLFVMDGEQGDRVIYHYPRLQAMQGSAETVEALAGPLERVKLAGAFRALPVKDANDGETVLCFRSYLPGPMRVV
jgi:hypothetical protein